MFVCVDITLKSVICHYATTNPFRDTLFLFFCLLFSLFSWFTWKNTWFANANFKQFLITDLVQFQFDWVKTYNGDRNWSISKQKIQFIFTQSKIDCITSVTIGQKQVALLASNLHFQCNKYNNANVSYRIIYILEMVVCNKI